MRIVVPHLGGGFGGKCEFHYEAQVAALARVAQRPVKLVFSRREEFVAPDHRREGQVLELETGVRRDGSIVSRRARLILDNGAYSADAPFFPQLAAMMAVGPYKVENVFVDASLAYTNSTPSRLGARAHRPAGLLGGRAAHGLGGRAAGHGSGRVPPPHDRAIPATRAPPARCSRRSAPPRRWRRRWS